MASCERRKIRRMGLEFALVGGILAASLSYVAGKMSFAFFGWGDDKEEDLRRFLPPWSENSRLILIGEAADGKPRVIDISDTDVYS